MLRKWADREQCLLSRAGLLPDHLHLTFGLKSELSPMDAAVSLMNNLAWIHDMKPILTHSFRVSTFGRYDLGAVRQQMSQM